MIPETDQQRNDGLDFLIDGYQDLIFEKQPDGTITQKWAFNPDIPWFQGHMINQPFGRHALFIKRLDTLAKWCYYFMSPERAKEISQGLLDIRDEYKRSIDGKSSETYRDKDNNQSSLLNLLFNRTIERKYQVKGVDEKSFIDGILHRDKAREQSN